jgi:protein-S-isoprenylcysteine O-methyltransferase Ste14
MVTSSQHTGRDPAKLHPVPAALRSLTAYLVHLRPVGGPCIFTVRQCVNLHKLLVLPIFLCILYNYGGDDPFAFTQPFGPAALMLMVTHGLYGLMWVHKDIFFPDRAWQAPMSPVGFIVVFSWPLGTYYLDMYCLVTSSASIYDSRSALCPLPAFASGDEPKILAAGLAFYIVGIFYVFGADQQSYLQLKYQPGRLITNGFFAHTRNPNYFGEFMIYMGYAILSCNYSFFVYAGLVWLLIFLPSMLAKEASLSRYGKEWDEWKTRTGFFFPYLPALARDIIGSGVLSRYSSCLGDDAEKKEA